MIKEIKYMNDDNFEDLIPGDTSKLDFPWYKKLLLKFSPRWFMKLHASQLGIEDKKIDYADKLFADAKRIDIQPLSGTSGRGFIITLDNKFSLWFFQEGDSFKYDGFEMGEYGDGEVTVFDELKED